MNQQRIEDTAEYKWSIQIKRVNMELKEILYNFSIPAMSFGDTDTEDWRDNNLSESYRETLFDYFINKIDITEEYF